MGSPFMLLAYCFARCFEESCGVGSPSVVSCLGRLIGVNKEFTPGQQADAHEAFMFIIERLGFDETLV